eukprot:g6671.t1
MTALQLAISQKNFSIMKVLLDEGVDVESKGNLDSTPLMSACASGFLDGVKLLIENGADLNASCSDGATSLTLAAKNEHLSVVSYLLDQESCSVNAADGDGFTALHYIAVLNDAYMTCKLIAKGSDVDQQASGGQVAIFLAARNACWNSMKVLSNAGADPNVCTIKQNCAFWSVMDQWNTEAIQILLKQGADVTRPRKDGTKAIDVAIKRNDFSIMKLMLNQGCKVEEKSQGDWTRLMNACHHRFVDGVRLLVRRGADINAQTTSGVTPVLIAAKRNCTGSLKVLLEAGADPNVMTEDGEVAIHAAMNQGAVEAVMMLLNHGAQSIDIRRVLYTSLFYALKCNFSVDWKITY